jgi:hypothetical protein
MMIPDRRIRFVLKTSTVGQDVHPQAGSTEHHNHSVDLFDERGLRLSVDNLKNKKMLLRVTFLKVKITLPLYSVAKNSSVVKLSDFNKDTMTIINETLTVGMIAMKNHS